MRQLPGAEFYLSVKSSLFSSRHENPKTQGHCYYYYYIRYNGNDNYYFNDDGKVAPYEASVDCPVISPIIKKNKNMTAVATAEDEGRRGEREEGILTPNFTPR